MAIERVYNVPLRHEFLKVPKYKRARKAITALREFISKHMKSDDVRIGRKANLKIWERGMKNPPHHIKVTVIKEDDGTVKVELFGNKYEEQSTEKKEEPKSVKEKLKQKFSGEKKTETKEKEEKTVAEKKENREEKPLEKKETPKTEKIEQPKAYAKKAENPSDDL